MIDSMSIVKRCSCLLRPGSGCSCSCRGIVGVHDYTVGGVPHAYCVVGGQALLRTNRFFMCSQCTLLLMCPLLLL